MNPHRSEPRTTATLALALTFTLALTGAGCESAETGCPEGTRCAVVDAGNPDSGAPVIDGGLAVDAGIADAAIGDAAIGDAAIDDAGALDACTPITMYADMDHDGYGDPSASSEACSPLADYVTNGGDCDDSCDACWAEAAEICDGLDNDCDTQIDEGVLSTFYRDDDGDGYGDTDVRMEFCDPPADGSYVTDSSDCNDDCATCNPDAAETCDGRDNDCDTQIDDGVTTRFYRDCDGDEYAATLDDAVDACIEPAPASDCPGGWTTQMPTTFVATASNVDWDCFDDPDLEKAADAYPGQTMYFGFAVDGTTASSGGTEFDYNCDGEHEQRRPVIANCGVACQPGWDQDTVPDCGYLAMFLSCSRDADFICRTPASTLAGQGCR